MLLLYFISLIILRLQRGYGNETHNYTNNIIKSGNIKLLDIIYYGKILVSCSRFRLGTIHK